MYEVSLGLQEIEKTHIQKVLDKTKGNKSQAARILKISRPTLDKKIRDYQLYIPTKNQSNEEENNHLFLDPRLNLFAG
ncbi:MAG: helix-turn-helix domain-containing protein [bacterium]